jgi:hypothetical protein
MSGRQGSTASTVSAAVAPASLAAWLAHLESLHPKGVAGIELGLERVLLVKEALGQQLPAR